MRYIYMFCLVLSSLFTYKQIYAETHLARYAFFIPKNAFQENISSTEVEVQKAAPSMTQKKTDKANVITTLVKSDGMSEEVKKVQVPVQTVPLAEKRNGAPKSKKIIAQRVAPKKEEAVKENPVKIKEEAKVVSSENSSLGVQENLENKSMKELLASLPYPDFKQPKFKQLYALYALDLRTLYREGDFLANPEQEASLAKANSVKRFEVK